MCVHNYDSVQNTEHFFFILIKMSTSIEGKVNFMTFPSSWNVQLLLGLSAKYPLSLLSPMFSLTLFPLVRVMLLFLMKPSIASVVHPVRWGPCVFLIMKLSTKIVNSDLVLLTSICIFVALFWSFFIFLLWIYQC